MTASNLPGELAEWQPVDERVLNNVEIADLGDGSKIVATNLGVPTQVANPWRATLRTVVAVLVGLVLALPTVNLILVAIADELARSGVDLPAWVTAAINGAIAAVALVSGVVTRVLAIPGVNSWLASNALTRGLTAIRLERPDPIAAAVEDGDPIIY